MRAPRNPGAEKFRVDIEGLRAVAVLSVVLYHAHVSAFGGGYVGVDVFFVISGYLITGLLWREVRERGRLSMGSFYGRRMRRLLPAAMLVLVVTMVAAVVWLPPLEIRSVWRDGLATAVYGGNYRFAASQANYLTSLGPPSPFQQYWSLGVEEQFYLVWPWLLAAAAIGLGPLRRRLLGGEARRSSAAKLVMLLGLVAVASFVFSLWLTTANQPWAFFSLPTRAWELAAGGLVALAAPALRRLPKGAAAALGWAGLAVVIWSVISFRASTPFPGVAALAPVGGAAAILAAGEVHPPFGPVMVLGRAVMGLLGRTSYSWYLWHWPVLIILPVAIGGSLDVWGYLGLAAGSWLLALATYHLVENPTRRSRWLSARPRRSLASGLALSATGVLACVVAGQSLPSLVGHGVAPLASIRHAVAPSSFGATGATGGAGGRSATVTEPPPTLLAADQAQVAKALGESVGRSNLPANVQPPLSQENAASSAPFRDGCLLGFLDAAIRPCVYGDTSSSTSVVLFGDSHAAMWFPAVDQVALDRHWQLIVQSKANCPPVDVPADRQPYPACSPWRNAVINRIQAIHAQLVVLAMAPNYDLPPGITQDDSQLLEGLTKVIATLRARGAHVMVMGPVPSPGGSVPNCLSAHIDQISECNVPAGEYHDPQLVGYAARRVAAERTAVEQAGGTFINVKPWFCTSTTCPVVVDNLLVFQDETHISLQYTTYLAPLVADEVRLIIP